MVGLVKFSIFTSIIYTCRIFNALLLFLLNNKGYVYALV
ncbi:hypothetical protein PCARR_a1490 [Pseudoalteromonas carrageenovora IAM 12662]|uniref:Uncharacterized protein n=1 Tax=Pseudoalteromonas carrageenovora IAM 12662 TaxID=1314868 RepID=A0ABR9ESC2_PSEVC|nr:hypothetical protein [Pseudoalteromonas carrageenovora IAM 12662]